MRHAFVLSVLIVTALAAGAETAHADFASAREAYLRADYATALPELRDLGAFQDHVEAQFLVGEMARLGLGMQADAEEATRWYRRAAERGHVGARFALARLLDQGAKGVVADPAEALKLYRKAFEQGIADAAFYIGKMYEVGRGMPTDLGDAIGWYEKAANAGSGEARYRLAEMSFSGTGMPQNFAKALAWTRSAAESGHARAQLALARMYQEGWPGLAPDPLRAYMWASLAAAAGEPQAATLRDRLRLSLRPAELAEAQKLAVGWRPAAK